jgi:hypothetical protein
MKSIASERLGIWFVLTSTFLNWSNISRVIRALSFITLMVILHDKQHRGYPG